MWDAVKSHGQALSCVKMFIK